jgi:hypothetical protein
MEESLIGIRRISLRITSSVEGIIEKFIVEYM